MDLLWNWTRRCGTSLIPLGFGGALLKDITDIRARLLYLDLLIACESGIRLESYRCCCLFDLTWLFGPTVSYFEMEYMVAYKPMWHSVSADIDVQRKNFVRDFDLILVARVEVGCI